MSEQLGWSVYGRAADANISTSSVRQQDNLSQEMDYLSLGAVISGFKRKKNFSEGNI